MLIKVQICANIIRAD